MTTIAKLKKETDALGLEVVQVNKKPSRTDYVRALREHYMPEGGIPYEEVMPMTCFAEWNLKSEEKEHIWDSPDWLAQRKLNGCRVILHFVKDVGVFAHSRTISKKTYRYNELTDKLLFAGYIPNFDATVDTEALVEKSIDTREYTSKGEITKSSLHSTTSLLHLDSDKSLVVQKDQDAPLIFHVFDIIRFERKDLRKETLHDRLLLLEKFFGLTNNTEISEYFKYVEYAISNKREYMKKIIDSGGEGIILKNTKSHYIDSSSRKRDAWVKVKKSVEFDAFVSGFRRGEAGTAWANLVGALEFSVNTDEGVHVLGVASSMPLSFREKISDYDATKDEVSLAIDMYDRVAQISGQDVSARELRLSHCVIDRWRVDGADGKSAAECKVNIADLKSASEWVGS